MRVSLVCGELVDAASSTFAGASLLGQDLGIWFEFGVELARASVAICALRAGCGKADMDAGLGRASADEWWIGEHA